MNFFAGFGLCAAIFIAMHSAAWSQEVTVFNFTAEPDRVHCGSTTDDECKPEGGGDGGSGTGDPGGRGEPNGGGEGGDGDGAE